MRGLSEEEERSLEEYCSSLPEWPDVPVKQLCFRWTTIVVEVPRE